MRTIELDRAQALSPAPPTMGLWVAPSQPRHSSGAEGAGLGSGLHIWGTPLEGGLVSFMQNVNLCRFSQGTLSHRALGAPAQSVGWDTVPSHHRACLPGWV